MHGATVIVLIACIAVADTGRYTDAFITHVMLMVTCDVFRAQSAVDAS